MAREAIETTTGTTRTGSRGKRSGGVLTALVLGGALWSPGAHLMAQTTTDEPAGLHDAWENGTAVRDEMLEHFERSSFKMRALSDAMPGDLYGWSPGEGVMSVARVYAHIARYNFLYLEENLGIAAPADIDWRNLESLTDKTRIIEALGRSIDHVRDRVAAMSPEALSATTTLYGRRVPGWAVLVQLVAHMNEHVGQAVAYARMNEIVPPWSR